MSERIVKNKRKCKCAVCREDITTDYKVKYKRNLSEAKYRYFHLSCYNRNILRRIVIEKEALTELNKSKRKLNKYKRYIILENL